MVNIQGTAHRRDGISFTLQSSDLNHQASYFKFIIQTQQHNQEYVLTLNQLS